MHGRNLGGILGSKHRIDTGGDGGGSQQFDRFYGCIEYPVSTDGVTGFPLGPVQAHLNGDQPVGGKPCDPLRTYQGAIGGDAGHDAPGMAGRQDLLKIRTDKRLPSAKIDLKDTCGVQLLHQVKGLSCREFVVGRIPG